MTAPVVLAIVGTDHHPFNRLVGWLDEWARDTSAPMRCFVQSGTSTPPHYAEWATTLPYDRLRELVSTASVAITHGGPGTIMDVRQGGLVPIVVPRRHSLGEHVDDHQVVFTERIAATGAIHLAHERAELIRLLESALAGSLEVRADAIGDNGKRAVESFGREVAALYQRRRPPRRLRGRARGRR